MAITNSQLKAEPSEYIKKRLAKMSAELLGHFRDYENVVHFRVYPGEPDKPIRVVCFTVGKEAVITCWDEATLVACTANQCKLPCSHAYCASNKLLELDNDQPEETGDNLGSDAEHSGDKPLGLNG